MLEAWDLVECDLQDVGVDVRDDALMSQRTWPWLKLRVSGLLSADTRLSRALVPLPAPPAHRLEGE